MALLRNITIGQYVPGTSFVHRLDPRTKILSAMGLIALLFLVDSFMGYGIAALFVFTSIFTAKLPLKFVIRGIRPLLVIIVLTLTLHIFMTDGRVLWEWGAISITYEGLIRGAMMGTRLIL